MISTSCLTPRSSVFIPAVLTFVVCAISTQYVAAQTTVWAIRGGISVGPENTLEGMGLCFDLGANGTEIDLWNTAPDPITGEKEIVLQHDRAVDRTTNGTGQIQNLSFDYVRTLDAGTHVHPHLNPIPFPGAQIPTLREALSLIKDRNKDVLIHVKHDVFNLGGEVALADVAAVVNDVEFPAEHLFTWTYLKDEAAAFSATVPGINIIFQGGADRNDFDWQELHDLGVSGVQIFLDSQGGDEQFNQSYVDQIHANGFFAFVNFPSLGQLDQSLEWGVEYVQTQKIHQYVPIIDAYNAIAFPEVMLGDVNQDGAVNFLDIPLFIESQTTGEYLAEADVDENGTVEFLDIRPFIVLLGSE